MLPNFKRPENEPLKGPTPPPVGNTTLMAQRPGSPPLRAAGDRAAPSVIGPDLVITGNLTSKGEMQIDGEVQGDIRATNLIVGERARVTGTIIADEAIIRGQVLGSLRCKRVMLQSSSHVEGDVYHQSLSIEQGAFFEGKSRRSDDPMGLLASAAGTSPQQPAAPLTIGTSLSADAPPPVLTPPAG